MAAEYGTRSGLLADIREGVDALETEVRIAEVDELFAGLPVVRIDAPVAAQLKRLALVRAAGPRDDEDREGNQANEADRAEPHARTLPTPLGSCNELR